MLKENIYIYFSLVKDFNRRERRLGDYESNLTNLKWAYKSHIKWEIRPFFVIFSSLIKKK